MTGNAQEFNQGHVIEGLDRLHIITTMLHEFLTDHPAIIKAGVQGDVHQAAAILLAAYQKVGELEDYKREECGTINDAHHLYRECIDRTRPRFIAWYGGECPVTKGIAVVIFRRDGLDAGTADPYTLDWGHQPDDRNSDIIAYRVIED